MALPASRWSVETAGGSARAVALDGDGDGALCIHLAAGDAFLDPAHVALHLPPWSASGSQNLTNLGQRTGYPFTRESDGRDTPLTERGGDVRRPSAGLGPLST